MANIAQKHAVSPMNSQSHRVNTESFYLNALKTYFKNSITQATIWLFLESIACWQPMKLQPTYPARVSSTA